MQRLVPGLSVLLIFSFFNVNAFAITLGEVRHKFGCDGRNISAYDRNRCAELSLSFCRDAASPQDSYCQTVSNKLGGTLSEIQGLNEANADQILAKYCVNKKQWAQACCSSDASSCQGQFLSKDGFAAMAFLQKAKNGGGGLESSCSNSKELNSNGAIAHYGLAGICEAKVAICSDECGQVISALNKCRAQNPNGKCSRLISQAKSTVEQCGSMSSNYALDTAKKYSDGSYMAGICEAKAGGEGSNGSEDPAKESGGNDSGGSGLGSALQSMLPGVLNALAAGDEGQMEDYQLMDCSSNPNLAGCAVPGMAYKDSWNVERGGNTASGSFESTSGGNGGDFNVPDGSDMNTQSLADGPPVNANPNSSNPVPNGGGGMPGGGGAASLGSNASAGGQAQASGVPKIEISEKSGSGYSQMAAGMNFKSGDGNGGYRYGSAGKDATGSENLNLKDFLPGGAKDPVSRLTAGLSNPTNIQIQDQGINIWNRISERFRSRCSQGLLKDCVP